MNIYRATKLELRLICSVVDRARVYNGPSVSALVYTQRRGDGGAVHKTKSVPRKWGFFPIKTPYRMLSAHIKNPQNFSPPPWRSPRYYIHPRVCVRARIRRVVKARVSITFDARCFAYASSFYVPLSRFRSVYACMRGAWRCAYSGSRVHAARMTYYAESYEREGTISVPRARAREIFFVWSSFSCPRTNARAVMTIFTSPFRKRRIEFPSRESEYI